MRKKTQTTDNATQAFKRKPYQETYTNIIKGDLKMHIVIVDRLTRIKLDERNDIVEITFIEEQNNYILRTRNNLEIQINKALYKIVIK